jgi:hypothetical protein
VTPVTVRVTEVAAARPVAAAVWPSAADTGRALLAAILVTEDVAARSVEATWPTADVAFAVADEAVPATAEATARPVEATGAAADDPAPALPGEPPVTPFAAADAVDVTVDADGVPVELDAALAYWAEPATAALAADAECVRDEVAA